MVDTFIASIPASVTATMPIRETRIRCPICKKQYNVEVTSTPIVSIGCSAACKRNFEYHAIAV